MLRILSCHGANKRQVKGTVFFEMRFENRESLELYCMNVQYICLSCVSLQLEQDADGGGRRWIDTTDGAEQSRRKHEATIFGTAQAHRAGKFSRIAYSMARTGYI